MTVREYLTTDDPIVDDKFIEYLDKSLNIMGFEEIKESTMAFLIERAISAFLDFTNLDVVPVRAKMAVLEYVISDYVLENLTDHSSDFEGLDVGSVESVKEGDTQVNFSRGVSVDGKAYLRKIHTDKLNEIRMRWLPYRRLAW